MAEAMLKLYGALGSPYSLKMRALLRYRRIPFVWIKGGRAHQMAQSMKAPVIPVLEYPDGSLKNDSTFLIYDLERLYPNDRSVVPPDPAQAFLAFLIEDFADEWMTKAMFAYRWLRLRDQARMSTWLAFDSFAGGGAERINSFAAGFRERQVGRMPLVGCTEANDPLIEASTRAVLAALEDHVINTHFLFGARPSLAEFGLYGQLSQLGTDPTAQELMRSDYPYTYRWLAHVDDLSGLDGEWSDPTASDPPVIDKLLKVIGDVYLPFLEANARALQQGASEVRLEAMGHAFAQAPFKYQAKCLMELRRAFGELPEDAARRLAPRLDGAGCLQTLRG